MMLIQELEIASNLALLAGKKIMEFYAAGVATEHKRGFDDLREPVTVADRTASEMIVAGIRDKYPNDGVLSEELADTDQRLSRERVWIIDPLDGTKGFIDGNGDFAVQIGLAISGESVLGVVYLPVSNCLYFAVKGSGAFSKIGSNDALKLECSGKETFSEMNLAISRHHPSPKMSRIINGIGISKTIRSGSVGLKVGLIATQVCDLYFHFSPHTKHWDTCAPEIIIKEAGGELTDLFGRRLVYNTRDVQNHNGILATCGQGAHLKTLNRLVPILREFGRKPK